MIESKLKAKNANSGQLFRPGWVSSAEYMLHKIEQPAQRQLSEGLDGVGGGGGGGRGPDVSCQLKFWPFGSCQLTFGPFISCQ